MQGHTLQIGTQTINYYQSAGTGPAVLFIHGNSMSGLSFRHQLASNLGAKHRLIAIDLPGHGLSTPAVDPQQIYTLPGYAEIVLAVVEQLDLHDAIVVGWSLGGHVVLEASDRLPNAAALVIYGAPPVSFPPAMDQAFLPNPAMAAVFTGPLTEEQIDAFAAACFRPDAHHIPEVIGTDIRRTDPMARQVFGESIRPGGYRDEIEAVANLSVPLAVFHGAQEQLVNSAYIQSLNIPTLWRGEIQIIPEAGHTPQWENPKHFNELLEALLEETA
ncbi:MAG TPA: alpha/beta hydrolase [Herpetosiphonaceae bacterium]